MQKKYFSNLQLFKYVFSPAFCILLLSAYYLWFVNKGLVIGDEGYTIVSAQRILEGHIPYRDFFLQYPPGFFYLLSLLYRIFGTTLFTGRIFTLIICVTIYAAALPLLHAFGIKSIKSKLLLLFPFAAFGFPLLNIPVVVWPTVLMTELIMLSFLYWCKENQRRYLISIGVLLAFLFLTKQNVALSQALCVNILLTYSNFRSGMKTLITSLITVNLTWLIPTCVWVYTMFFIFSKNTIGEFLSFNSRYLHIYKFSYPPLTMLAQPLGIAKLLPYYLPIILIFLLLVVGIKKKEDKKVFVLFLPIVGFITTVFPTSDLLHVYPYLPLVLVGFVLVMKNYFQKFEALGYILLCICTISGFYLTLVKEYNRGQPSYLSMQSLLHIPTVHGIWTDKDQANNLNALYTFINSHSKSDEYIFVYSYSPMLYFLTDRKNPSRYSIYAPGYLTEKEERQTIQNIQKKQVHYVIADWQSNFGKDDPLSAWVQKQKKLQTFGLQYTVYEVQK